MRDEQMPDDGLKRFGVRGDHSGIDSRNDDARISDASGIAAVTADDADDRRPDALSEFEGIDEIGADVFFYIAAAHRKDEEGVGRFEAARFKPRFEDRGPAFVVGPRGEF